MTENIEKEAILLLEDGTHFRGRAVGQRGTTSGEICFNTGMTGYQEIFTDPSYFGQIMITTNVHIGNYGTLKAEDQSEKIQIAGLIARNFTEEFSRDKADLDIQEYFEQHGITGIDNVDTRTLVRHIRDKGAMNCIISSEILDVDTLQEKLQETPSMEGLELSSRVSTSEAYYVGSSNSAHRVAVLDFGVKKNILACLEERGCYLKVFPAQTKAEELEAWKADAYFLSNGPGDPAAMDYAIRCAKSLIDSGKPTFGICLGHQILALAMGIPTYKMHHGHRGINHPVKNLLTGKCEITSQNHGFCVSEDALASKSDQLDITHINLNDHTVEGMQIKGKPVFSVQFHPEAAPGPNDSKYLFDQFVNIIEKSKA